MTPFTDSILAFKMLNKNKKFLGSFYIQYWILRSLIMYNMIFI